jgi:uncharacterized protein (DUF885 family)
VASVTDIADRYVAELVELDPVTGTQLGDPRSFDRLPDNSPAGIAARAELVVRTLHELESAVEADEAERRARTVLREALETESAAHELGEPFRRVRSHAAPLERIRRAFDLMPTDAADDWEAVVRRMRAVPEAVAGIEATLREGLARGLPAARRQAAVVAAQARAWGGVGGDGYMTRLLQNAPPLPTALREDATRAASTAQAAIAQHAQFLATDYHKAASDADAVGRERYLVASRGYTGVDLDLEDTYAWGWDELHRLAAEIEETAAQIVEHGGFAAARAVLNDPSRAINGVESFRVWLQEVTDRSVADLDGRHFDMAPQARRVECMIAPPGGPAAMYYTAPSEDWSRPGRTWYPAGDRTVFPTWEEVSTAYHEGVPGHHLQHVQVMTAEPRLNRFQRFWFNSGHGEGWALYAERLMDELGYHQQPDTRLGMLSASSFRAARVVVDIGLHLELAVPRAELFHPGERWNFELAREFMAEHVARGPAFVTSEVDRYLGMPGQAITYKIGEREWLDIRAAVRAEEGAGFDLKRFHSRALGLGPMGLGQLRNELTQAGR